MILLNFVLLFFPTADIYILERNAVTTYNAPDTTAPSLATILQACAEVDTADIPMMEITAVTLVVLISVITPKLIVAEASFARNTSRREEHVTIKMQHHQDVEEEEIVCQTQHLDKRELAKILSLRKKGSFVGLVIATKIAMRGFIATKLLSPQTPTESVGNQPTQPHSTNLVSLVYNAILKTTKVVFAIVIMLTTDLVL